MSSKRKTAETAIPSVGKEEGHGPGGSGSAEPRDRIGVKRQRVSRACDQCRAAREKCDGIQPLCFPCVSQNRPCTYQANPKKRGVQTGYIRTLELALAWVFEKVPGSEDALSSLLSHEGGQGQRLLAGSNSGAANRLHQKWRRSRVHKDIDRILSGGGSIPPQDDQSPSIDDASDSDGDVDPSSGPSRGPDGSARATSQGPISQDASRSSHQEPPRLTSTEQEHDKAAPASLNPPSSAVLGTRSGLELPQNHWRLMDIYFAYTHCWLPILEKQDMFQASYLYSSGEDLDLSPQNPSSSTHAELWSALALASCQDAVSARPATGPGIMTPAQIYDIARSLVPPDDGDFQIHHTRALILLSLVNLGRRNLTSAWLMIGKAVRIFLQVSPEDRSGHEKQRQRSQCLFIACFIMDTMISQQLGRPPHLTAEDMAEATNISENDLDEWQPWAACEGFGQGSEDSRNSRNPAYCLSTFNQVYDIFKVISRDMARKRARAGYGRALAMGLPQLQQAINIQAPFGAYILSTSAVQAAPVPSPYLLRILYLWATGLVDAISSSAARLMIAVIEEYRSRFGACAMPPFLAACLACWSGHEGFEGLEPQDKARLSALQDSHAVIWGAEPAASSAVHRHGVPKAASFPYQVPDEAGHRQNAVLPAVSAAVPTPSFADSHLPGRPSPQAQGRRHDVPVTSPYLFHPYGNSGGLLHSSANAVSRDTAVSDMENAMAAQAAATLPPPYHMPFQSGSALTGGSTNPTDYDTLLDDLASIDYADRVETDPQFMLNLGFAPGCDLNELLSLDFARF